MLGRKKINAEISFCLKYCNIVAGVGTSHPIILRPSKTVNWLSKDRTKFLPKKAGFIKFH